MALARAALGAVLVLVASSVACRADPPREKTPPAASETGSGEDAAPSGKPFVASSVPASQWTDKSPSAVELVVAPNRTALLTYEGFKGGYIIHHGDEMRRLPREWFGAGPPRRDILISADGARLAVPMPPTGEEAVAMMVYDTVARRFLARVAITRKDAPDGASFEGKLSEDGKSVVWTSSSSRACMLSDIETGTIAKCPGK